MTIICNNRQRSILMLVGVHLLTAPVTLLIPILLVRYFVISISVSNCYDQRVLASFYLLYNRKEDERWGIRTGTLGAPYQPPTPHHPLAYMLVLLHLTVAMTAFIPGVDNKTATRWSTYRLALTPDTRLRRYSIHQRFDRRRSPGAFGFETLL